MKENNYIGILDLVLDVCSLLISVSDRKDKFMCDKVAYVCGPLTELPPDTIDSVKRFYSQIGDVCQEIFAKRAFVPHEHYDPIKNPKFTPQEVDTAERYQVCNKTSVLIVVALAPSWGGGIEVEMANQNNVPVILLCEREKFKQRKISRLLRGNPAVMQEIIYYDYYDALAKLEEVLLSTKGTRDLVLVP